jgi:hypothetical protein
VTILARPVRLLSTVVSSSATFQQGFALPGDWWGASSTVANKLQGFRHLEGTFVARFQVNATPFQCGKYWMFYVPYTTDMGKDVWTDLSCVTAFPGVELDLGSSKVAELRIPLVGPYCPIALSGLGKWGDLFIVELSPIADGDSAASAHASLHIWLEGAKVSLPTVTKLVAQSKSEGEVVAATGTVSSAAFKIGKLASNVGTLFPQLSHIAQPAAWAANLVSGVASYFGFSKPNDITTTSIFASIPARGFTHGSGPDAGTVLGMCQDNSIETRTDVFGTSSDELHVNYVCGRPAVIGKFSWNNTQPVDTALVKIPVAPNKPNGDYTTKCPTPLQYFSALCRFWTGSICYRLSFAKTMFHTGRIELVYIPDETSFDPELNPSNDLYKWVVDLSTTSEITVTIPWVRNHPWLPTDVANGVLSVRVLNPLNVSSESASPSIDFLVWHFCGDDYKLQAPVGRLMQVTFPEPESMQCLRSRTLTAQILNETSSQNVHGSKNPVPLFPYTPAPFLEACKASCGEQIVSFRTVIKRFTPFVRFRPPRKGGFQLYPDPLLYPWGIYIDPWFVCIQELVGTSAGYQSIVAGELADATEGESISRVIPQWHAVSLPFRFLRGSVRFKYITDTVVGGSSYQPATPRVWATTGLSTERLGPFMMTTDINTATMNNPCRNSFAHCVPSDANNVCEVTVPYYSLTPMSLCTAGQLSSDKPDAIRPTLMFYIVPDIVIPSNADPSAELVRNPVDTQLPWFPTGHLMTACGDDFSFSFLGGCPRVKFEAI